jgi:ferredoxin/flavodoxin
MKKIYKERKSGNQYFNNGGYMKDAVIFYFSGTGNTWWISSRIAQELEAKGISVETVSIEKSTVDQANDLIYKSEYVGFGYPIYGSDMPQIMKDFLDSLEEMEMKSTFVFCTQWGYSGDGAHVCERAIRKKGYNVWWAEHFFMPNCISAGMLARYTNDPQKLKSILDKNRKRIDRLALRISKNVISKRGYTIFSTIGGLLQRIPYRKMYQSYKDKISINQEKCIGCKRCINICPVDNLLDTKEGIKTKGECILCGRCYNFCPVQAIEFNGKPHDTKKGNPYQGPVKTFKPEMLIDDSKFES